MAPSKTTSGSKAKRSSKPNTRFYVVKKVQGIHANLTGKLEAYNRKYVAQPLKTGRTFVEDLKAEPRKSIVKLINDGKARITDLNNGVRTKVDGYTKNGQAILTKASKNPRETFNDLMEDGKAIINGFRSNTQDKYEDLMVDFKVLKAGVEKDTRLVMADVMDSGKKVLERVPGKQWIEREISRQLEAMPAKFNLPSKNDIDDLALQVRNLGTKVNKLSKTRSV